MSAASTGRSPDGAVPAPGDAPGSAARMSAAGSPRTIACADAEAEECDVLPLIEAREAYPAMERAILGARRTLLLSFRILDPATRLVSGEARARGLADWGGLLADAAARGVAVRIALADFDPLHAGALHRHAWRCVTSLAEAVGRIPAHERAPVEILCVTHEGEAGHAIRVLLWPATAVRLARLVRRLRGEAAEPAGRAADGRPVRADGVGAAPGLWTHADPHGERPGVRPWPPPRIRPATHHQKLALVDGMEAFVGGLDVNPRRYDGSDHDRPAPQTWHDVMARVRGPAAAGLFDWFARFWNDEIDRDRSLRRARGQALHPALAAPSPLPGPGPTPRTTELADPARGARDSRDAGRTSGSANRKADGAAAPEDGPSARRRDGKDADANPGVPGRALAHGGGTIAVVATASRPSRSPFAIGPRPVRTGIEDAYRALIAEARRLLYVETQFLRSEAIVTALERRAREAPELVLLVVLPAAPEDVAFKGDRGLAMRHGEWLQVRAVDRLRRAFAGRAGFFTLAAKRPRAEGSERDAVFGAAMVYVHAKVAVADDRAAIVSSANLNGRSMRWDTEVGVRLDHPEGAARLRRALFDAHLGPQAGELPDAPGPLLAAWRQAAHANAVRAPGDRAGLVLPYPLERARSFARRAAFVPNDAL